MREIETRTSTMTDEREDITPEQWVDILGKEDNFLYTICRATAFGDVEMGLHRVGDGPADCSEVEIGQGNARTSLEVALNAMSMPSGSKTRLRSLSCSFRLSARIR
jgi:hypothetical protein